MFGYVFIQSRLFLVGWILDLGLAIIHALKSNLLFIISSSILALLEAIQLLKNCFLF